MPVGNILAGLDAKRPLGTWRLIKLQNTNRN